ncbi:plasmid partition protein ParG [Kitasatospora sp. NPDC004272]
MPPRSRRELVEAAVTALKDDPELVAFIQQLAAVRKPGGKATNVPIRLSEERSTRIKAKAKDEGTTVTAVIADGIEDFLAGALPVSARRRTRGIGQQLDTMLNVRPDADLVDRLKKHCAAAAESWLKPSVVYAAILDRFDPPAAADEAPGQD